MGQHGILCLVCLSFYEFLVQPGRSSPPRICCSFQERVWGGTRPWHEADGIPDKEGRKVCLPRHRQANHGEWGTPLEAMEAALELEKTVNQSLLDMHKGAEGDAHLCDFLEGNFLDEQVDAIKEISGWITKLKRAGPGIGFHLIDKDRQLKTLDRVPN